MNKYLRNFIIVAANSMIAYSAPAQTCNCESNFEWVKKTFEQNDAGFQYIIDKKGEAAYAIHNQLLSDKIKAAKTSTECTGLLYEWLTFFRSGHIGIENLVHEPANTGQATQQTAQSKAVYEAYNVDIPKFEKYVAGLKNAGYEGIWQTGVYKIGIQKEGGQYIGFIIESGADTWKPKQVKLKITKEDSVTFYMRDHTPQHYVVEAIGKNYLEMGSSRLKRISPILPEEKFAENYIKLISTYTPYQETLNSTTLYLRIPSFDISEKKAIDSVLAANKEQLLKTENLILDLRNNGGGGDASFRELIPFLYTDPVRTVWLEFLSTKQNNQRFLDFANDTTYGFDEETKKWMKDAYGKLEQHLGEFVNLHNQVVSIDTLPEVYEYPKKVGIIINEGNASTTEQFLLAAKQSKKVKLFGTTTSGALDISNMYSVESPCKEFKLWYCLSKSLRIPGMTIDDIGLQPDYYLDKTIPPYKWVEFVNNRLNE